MQKPRKARWKTGRGRKEVEAMTSKPELFGERAPAGRWAAGTHVAGEASAIRATATAPAPKAVAPRAQIAVAVPPLDFTAAMRRVEAEYYDAA
jgi:hypothetical protein